MPPKINISKQQHYACIMCGRCCRRFQVLVTHAELERFAKLDWGEDGPPKEMHNIINGYAYFKRKPEDGGCIFQDDNGLCIMHRKFGFAKKALTCRGYPFNIVSTFPGEVSVLARMDCPAVVQDKGPLITSQHMDIAQLVSEMRFGMPFTAKQMAGLERKTLECLCGKLQEMLQDSSMGMASCAKLMMQFVIRAQQLGASFLNDEPTMAEVYPSMIEKLREGIEDLPKYDFGFLARLTFRQHFSNYCRRDEEIIIPSFKARLRQFWNIARLCFGGGNLKSFGYEHPDIAIRKTGLLKHHVSEELESIEENRTAWASFRRFISVRLECFQFFGASYYGADVFSGLRALMLTYALALAFARIWAASRGSARIDASDVEHAVMAVDHCHGRSPALNFFSSRRNENMLSAKFSSIVHSLGVN